MEQAERDTIDPEGSVGNGDRPVTAAECHANLRGIRLETKGIKAEVAEVKADGKRLFWMQLANLGGVIAVLAGLLCSIAAGVAVWAITSNASTAAGGP